MPTPKRNVVSTASKRIWFLDTSSLLSMADDDIEAAVLDEIGDDPVMIIDVVRDELTRRAAVPGTDGLAKAALNRLQSRWRVMDTAGFVKLEDIRLTQEDVADGRTLTDDMQHWAESTIIALARRSAIAGLTSIKVLLSEDYDARRVACAVPYTRGISIHALFHERVQRKRMTSGTAAELANPDTGPQRAGPALPRRSQLRIRPRRAAPAMTRELCARVLE